MDGSLCTLTRMQAAAARRDLFERRFEFRDMRVGRDPLVFASEYAVLQDAGQGNLQVGRSQDRRPPSNLIGTAPA